MTTASIRYPSIHDNPASLDNWITWCCNLWQADWHDEQYLGTYYPYQYPVWQAYILFLSRNDWTPSRHTHLLPTFVSRSCWWSLPVLFGLWPLPGMLWWDNERWLLLWWGKRVWWCGEELCGSFDHMSVHAWVDTLSTPGDDNGTSPGHWVAGDCDIWLAVWRRYGQRIKF